MRLSPLDIKKQDFKRAMRGVDAEEVQAFLQMVADQWQELLDDHSKLEHKITELETKLEHYKQVEEALQEAVKTARESSRQTLEAAKNKAQSIVEAAAESAERLQQKAQEDQYDLRRDIESLRARRRETLARLRNLLRTELELLEDFDRQFPIPVQPEPVPAEELVAEPDATAEPGEQEPEMIDLSISEDVDLQPEAQEEFEAIQDIEELEAVGASEEVYDAADVEYSEDTLVFTPEEDGVSEEHVHDSAGPGPAPHGSSEPHAQAQAPPPPRESHRDSTEMDKIRKILDDLA
jgi:cell division initiation protein